MSAHEIRDLIDEIAKLSQTDLAPSQFYDHVLGRLTTQLRVAGTAAWMCGVDSADLLCQRVVDGVSPLNGELTNPDHQQLLSVVRTSGQPNLFQPGTLSQGTNLRNPTEFALGVCPIKVGDQVVAILESFHPANGHPEQQQAGLKLLTIVAGVATNYHRNLELRWRRELDRFSHAIHKSLHPTETAYIIANEGRPVIDCDRLSLFVKRGRKCRLEAVSGLESVHRRANETRLIEKLATRVLATGEAFTYPDRHVELPPQIEEAARLYVDESQAKYLTLIPLVNTPEPDENESPGARKKKPEVLGALVAEQFSGAPFSADRLEIIGAHAARALDNATEHNRIFMLWLWKAIGKMSWLVRARTLPWTIVVTALIVGLVLGAIYVPAEFRLTAEGTLQPQERRNVFAPYDGRVEVGQLFVRHDSPVEEGGDILKIESPQLRIELQKITQEIESAKTERSTKLAERGSLKTLVPDPQSRRVQENRVSAEIAVLETRIRELDIQRQLVVDQVDELLVKSPIKGKVITWDVMNQLRARPVQKGQTLLTVANLDGEWVLELLLPDRRLEHLYEAREKLGRDLEVSFILATNPGRTLSGKIEKVSRSTTLHQEEGLSVLVTVAIDETDIPELRPGAEVVGRIYCGERPIGYVWLHDLFEFVQSRILFRLF